MPYDESSFMAGIAVGRALKGWSNKPGVYMMSNKRSGTLNLPGSVRKDTLLSKPSGIFIADGEILM